MRFSASPVIGKTTNLMISGYIWLGISAMACTAGTYLLLHQDVQILYICFVFFGTVTVYNLHALFSRLEKRKNRVRSFQPLPLQLRILLPVAGTMTLLFYSVLTVQNKILILLPAAASVLYVAPVIGGKRLRDFAFLKIFLIIIAWTAVTYGAPLLRVSHWWSDPDSFYLMAERLFFFFAIALPFDMRDADSDQNLNLRTIPNSIGIPKSRRLAIAALTLSVLFFLIFEVGTKPGFLPVLPLAAYVICGCLILRVHKRQTPLFYTFILDGMIFVYGLCLIITFLRF